MDFLLFSLTAAAAALTTPRRIGSLRSRLDDARLSMALRAGTSLNAAERICAVSEVGNVPVPGGVTRSEMRLRNLWHRATYVLVRWVSDAGDGTDGGGRPDRFLLQRRSAQKDYCPSKFDPTPGGVVGVGESYLENAVRETAEEMGIDVSDGNPQGNALERLFTFRYSDDRVNVWGEFYEAEYRGRLEDLILQPEEVDEVIPVTAEELHGMMLDRKSAGDFMPDSLYAMKLYFQRKADVTTKRRLLEGCAGSDLGDYRLRPKPKVVFFDCDDTLYFDDWTLANQLTQRIRDWCVEKLDFEPGRAYQLYKKYGTALSGLLAEGYVPETDDAIDAYLRDVHDVPVEDILKPDAELRRMLLRMDPSIKRYVFTASVSHHAERCLRALGIDDLFERPIIDVKSCSLETKHDPKSFEAAMRVAGVSDPEACVLLDDSVKNMATSRRMGWRSVLVGTVGRDTGEKISSEDAEVEVDRIHEIESALPELFAGGGGDGDGDGDGTC